LKAGGGELTRLTTSGGGGKKSKRYRELIPYVLVTRGGKQRKGRGGCWSITCVTGPAKEKNLERSLGKKKQAGGSKTLGGGRGGP